MARSRLDLLPLLDVFMVVLFVFATIQEQRLDDTSRDRERLEERVDELTAALRQSEAGGHSRDAKRQIERIEVAEQSNVALVEVKHEASHLRDELVEARKAFADEREKVRSSLERMGAPAEALERLDVLSRVLDKYSVFEIEVMGGLDAEGRVINRCCYRVDPLDEQWRACGEVPADEQGRERWLAEGGRGLAEALRRTKGGNAMTLVRQDHAAGHRIASRLVDELRQEFSDQHFYAEEELTLPDHCAP